MVKLAFDPADLVNITDPREMPAYTVPEAAWALRIPVSTIRAWFFGQEQFEPLLRPALAKSRLLSFNNIVEAFVLRSVRTKHRIPMPYVRSALDRVENELRQTRPLLHESFRTDGVRLFVEAFGSLQDATTGQRALFDEHLDRIQFKDGQASKLFPFYYHDERNSPRAIAIDIERCFGRPIVDRISIPTEVIHDRWWWAGEQIDVIASDYRCEVRDIEEALRYERAKNAA